MPQLLIVESSSTESLRARLILERAGYQVQLAAEEDEALRLASECKPDAILLGALTPRLNGFATCGKLRLEPKTYAIPIVILGTPEELGGFPSGLDLVGLLQKPYDPPRLVSKVQEVLNGRAAAPAPDASTEISRLQRELDAAHQMRSQFLANISHELRTPLHEITGMLELVFGTQLTGEQRGYLDTLQGSSNALLSLIGDLIEYTELEGGQLDLVPEEFAVGDLLQRLEDVFGTRAGDKGLQFTLNVAPDVPPRIEGDQKRLRQVLSQIIANAVKFTDCGEIELNVHRGQPATGRDDAAPQPMLEFSVRDTGIGVPPERQQVIFEPFQQADISSTRRYGGTGIGLAIAKQLVERMHGRIWLESRPGEGSTFHFAVPLAGAAPAPTAAAPVPRSTMQNFRILVAEDSPTNQLIARMSLSKAGHTVTLAPNGEVAVKAYAESSGNPFDLILMDVSMPVMDGLEATRLIREREKTTGDHIMVIAMTAFATKEYQIKCIESGMDAYVTKPVRMDELKRVVDPLLAEWQIHPPVPVPAAVPPPAPASPAPTAPATAQAAAPAPAPAPPAPTAPATAQAAAPAPAPAPEAPSGGPPPVQLADALEVTGGDVDILREAASISLSEIPEQVTLLEEGIAKSEARTIEAKAHRLKGILGNLGGADARKIAQELETMGESKQVAYAEPVFRRLVSEIARVQAFYADDSWEAEARKLQESMDG